MSPSFALSLELTHMARPSTPDTSTTIGTPDSSPEVAAAAEQARREFLASNEPMRGTPMPDFAASQETFLAQAEREVGKIDLAPSATEGNFIPHTQAQLDAIQRDRERLQGQQAAAMGVPVSQIHTVAATKQAIAKEPRFMCIVQQIHGDVPGTKVVRGSINGMDYEIVLGVPQGLPYSLVAEMVCQGRMIPPQDCPELMVHAIHAAAKAQGHDPVAAARITNRQAGAYLGESAQGASGMDIYDAGVAMVNNGRGMMVPAVSTIGGSRL